MVSASAACPPRQRDATPTAEPTAPALRAATRIVVAYDGMQVLVRPRRRAHVVEQEHGDRSYGDRGFRFRMLQRGHPGMIEDVTARLSPRDFRVKKERYWEEGARLGRG